MVMQIVVNKININQELREKSSEKHVIKWNRNKLYRSTLEKAEKTKRLQTKRERPSL